MSVKLDGVDVGALQFLQNLALAADGKARGVNPLNYLDERGLVRPAMLLQPHETLTDLSPLLLGKMRYTGAYGTSSLPAMVAYVDNFPSIIQLLGFVDPLKMSCRVYLDAGNKENPGRAEHSATLSLNRNAFYKALLEISGKPQGQKELAEFLEDWSTFWRAPIGQLTEGETVRQRTLDNPEPDFDTASLPKAIRSIRAMTVDATGKKDSFIGSHRRELTEMEKVEARATGEYPLPEVLVAVCQPYNDLRERFIRVRLSTVSGKEGEAPKITPRIVAQEKLVEDMGDEFVTLTTQAFDGKVRVMKGAFEPGK